MQGRLIFRIGDTVLFCWSQHVVIQKIWYDITGICDHIDENLAFENFEMKIKKKKASGTLEWGGVDCAPVKIEVKLSAKKTVWYYWEESNN